MNDIKIKTKITEFTPPNHGDQPYDIVIIRGKIGKSHFYSANDEKFSNQLEAAKNSGLSCCVIGDGISEVNREEMLKQLYGKISPSTSVNVYGHGVTFGGKHHIQIYDKSDEKPELLMNFLSYIPFTKKNKKLHLQKTSNIFEDIKILANGKPVNCHLWSCFAGAAAKDVGSLGDDSILISHSSDKDATFVFMMLQGISRTIDDYIKNANLYKEKPEKEAFDAFVREVIKTPETLTISTCSDGEVISHTSRPPKVALLNDTSRYVSEYNLNDFFDFRRNQLGEQIDTKEEIKKAMDSYSSKDTVLEYKKQDFVTSGYHKIGKLTKYLTAIKQGNAPGIDVNSAESFAGTTPLMMAAGYSRDTLNQLLSTPGIAVDQTDINGRTALHYASYLGNKGAVKKLIAAGADVNKADNFGCTPLYSACQNDELDNVEVVEELLKIRNIDVNKADIDGRTPLQIACENCHDKIVSKLVKAKGIDINKADNNCITPLMAAIMEYPNFQPKEALRILEKNGAKLPDKIEGKPFREWVSETRTLDPIKCYKLISYKRGLIGEILTEMLINLRRIKRSPATANTVNYDKGLYATKITSESQTQKQVNSR